MLALATVGIEQTKVKLATDPTKKTGGVKIDFVSENVGAVSIDVASRMSAKNPKTSAVVPLSVVKAVRNYFGAEVVGI